MKTTPPLRSLIFEHLERMLNKPDSHGIYPTTEFMDGLEADLLKYIHRETLKAAANAPENSPWEFDIVGDSDA